MDYNFIYKKYFQRLVYFADKIVGNWQQAEDIAQESLIKVWQRFERFDNEPALKGYMYQTVKNTCFNFLKKESRLNKKQEGFFYVTEKIEQDVFYYFLWAELLTEITNGVEKLPRAEANIFKLAYFQDMNTEQISKKTGLSLQTIRNQRVRALQKLRLRFY